MLITMPILASYYHYYSLDGQGIESVPCIHCDIKCHWQTNGLDIYIHASVDVDVALVSSLFISDIFWCQCSCGLVFILACFQLLFSKYMNHWHECCIQMCPVLILFREPCSMCVVGVDCA